MMISTNLAEDDVLAIEPLGLGGAEEELGPVGVRSSVGHGEHSWGEEKLSKNYRKKSSEKLSKKIIVSTPGERKENYDPL